MILGFLCWKRSKIIQNENIPSCNFIIHICRSFLLYNSTHQLVHPRLSQHHVIDVLWSYSHYVEAIAVYPQLLLFSRSRVFSFFYHNKQKGEVEPFTSHFVFSLAVSRSLTFLFWCSCWKELNINTHWLASLLAGRSVLFSQIIQIFLMGNYVFYYVKAYYFL